MINIFTISFFLFLCLFISGDFQPLFAASDGVKTEQVEIKQVETEQVKTEQVVSDPSIPPMDMNTPSDNAFLLFKSDLEVINDTLKNKHYSSSLYLLNDLISKIKLQQEVDIDKFFPKEFQGFSISSYSNPDSDPSFSDNHYGVLFAKRYTNSNGNNIDFNVVYLDDSIKEYINIINNKSLAQGLQNTEIITIQGFKALHTTSEDRLHLEQNIIISEDT